MKPNATIGCIATIALALGGCRNHALDLQRMIRQPRSATYRQAPFTPPPGTVPRPSADSDAIAQARLVAMGHAPDPETARRVLGLGASRYATFCAVCHGAGGYGGSIVAANMHGLRPPSLRAALSSAGHPDAAYRMISAGGERMPSFAEALPPSERWAVIAFLGRLRATPSAGDTAARDDSIRAAAPGQRGEESLR
ncbi:MAG TPA: c-type cytochrome [Gemmatimonadales bacterium]|jgi:mono/diheme cytochrome c family protein